MCADFSRERDDFEFVGAGEGTKNRQFGRGFDGDHVAKSLRSDLSKAVTSDEGEGMVAPRENVSDAQHHAAIKQDAAALRRVTHDFALNGLERNAIELGAEL